jgi:NAD(P)-dependent dehydrogenase (short-subunit alcohol dehydrogenase family)
MDLELKGKVAVVTGATQGIGLAVAEGLAREGVHLLLCARDEERIKGVAADIGQRFGVKAVGMKTDVTDTAEIERLAEHAEQIFAGVDILVSNAGVGSHETIMEAPDDEWQYYWDLFVMAAVRLARGLVPSMKRRGGGVILHNASICAKQPLGYEPIYNTTKAALMMLSKCMANELIPSGIRVNCINPGLVLTPDWYKTAGLETEGTGKTAEDYLDAIARENAPIGRFATPEEMAEFFVFLCSPRASYCVGSSYYVDGGWLKVVS